MTARATRTSKTSTLRRCKKKKKTRLKRRRGPWRASFLGTGPALRFSHGAPSASAGAELGAYARRAARAARCCPMAGAVLQPKHQLGRGRASCEPMPFFRNFSRKGLRRDFGDMRVQKHSGGPRKSFCLFGCRSVLQGCISSIAT